MLRRLEYRIVTVTLLVASLSLPSCDSARTPSSVTPPLATLTPEPASCVRLEGAWQASWAMPLCGPEVRGAPSITVMQSSCSISFMVSGLGSFEGELEGNRSRENLTIRMDPAAPGTGSGCPNPTRGRLDVQADGSAVVVFGTGPSPCCQHGSVSLRR
jgi:hypothetical protein